MKCDVILFSAVAAMLGVTYAATRFVGEVTKVKFKVVYRALPTESDEQPKIYRITASFGINLRNLKKVKKSNGHMLAVNEVKLKFSSRHNFKLTSYIPILTIIGSVLP